MLLFSRTTAIDLAITSAFLCIGGGLGINLVYAQDADVAIQTKRSYRSLNERFTEERRLVLYSSRKLEGSCGMVELEISCLYAFVCLVIARHLTRARSLVFFLASKQWKSVGKRKVQQQTPPRAQRQVQQQTQLLVQRQFQLLVRQ